MAMLSSSTSLRASRPCAAPSRRTTVLVQAVGKADLAEKLALRLDMKKNVAISTIDSLLDIITAEVKAGERVTLVGFGSWEQRERKARAGRNPQTGEALAIPACKTPVFSASKAFKDLVNGREPKVKEVKEPKPKAAPKPRAEPKPKADPKPKAEPKPKPAATPKATAAAPKKK